jgi:hypothetical protein
MNRRVRGIAVIAAIKSREQMLERIEPCFIRMVRGAEKISVEGLQELIVEGPLNNARMNAASAAKPPKSLFFWELDSGRIQAKRNHF